MATRFKGLIVISISNSSSKNAICTNSSKLKVRIRSMNRQFKEIWKKIFKRCLNCTRNHRKWNPISSSILRFKKITSMSRQNWKCCLVRWKNRVLNWNSWSEGSLGLWNRRITFSGTLTICKKISKIFWKCFRKSSC